ncbi:hypothetical protein [Thauera sp. 2A1]|uniref:hypothetical protein n=1 Tax=Thauera sp. 2A1 TaxID=2570191 RepID=UPI0012917CC8|nr:hypothetical protein [Thauera sp. 2A1]KAI5912969.1 hypothetical protein GH664_19640 [Thauera sp. 2A1]
MFAEIPLLLFLCFGVYASLSAEGRGIFHIDRNPLSIVIWIYVFSGFCGLFLDQSDLPTFHFKAYSFVHAVIYAVLVVLCLLPILNLRRYRFDSFDFRMTSLIHGVFLVASVSAWFAAIYQAPYAVISFVTGAYSIRKDLNVEGLSVLPEGYLTTLAVGISSFHIVYMIMFYLAVIKRMGLFVRASTFLGSTLYVISSMTFAARDGVVFFLFGMLFFYGVFREELGEAQRRMIVRLAVTLSFAAVAVLGTFTAQRFTGLERETDLVGGTVSYIGQQVYVFSETMVAQERFYGLSLRFPFFQKLLFGEVEDVVRTSPYEWSFGTFLKDFYSVSGWSSLLSFTLTFSGFFCWVLWFGKRFHPVTYLLMVAFYFQFMMSGVFYYRLGTYSGNQYTLIYWFLVLLSCYVFSGRVSSAVRGEISR